MGGIWDKTDYALTECGKRGVCQEGGPHPLENYRTIRGSVFVEFTIDPARLAWSPDGNK